MRRKSIYTLSGAAGALALGLLVATPGNAAPLANAKGLASAADSNGQVTLVDHRRHRHGYHYYGGWRQSHWHQRHYNKHRNYHYGPRYRHHGYGHVRPFKHFVRALAGYGYYNFSRPKFHGHGRHWTPHYFVSAHDGYGRGVNLRVCAYTGNVLGWRYY